MRGDDLGDALRRRIVVEEYAAAAVDLPIDEAGRERSAAEIDALAVARPVRHGAESDDSAMFGDERVILENPYAVEDAGAIIDFAHHR